MFIANDIGTFKADFINGLQQMLQANTESLGAFILVLANSMQDKALYTLLSPALKTAFSQLNTQTLTAPAADIAVFSALQTLGISKLSDWKHIQKTPWELVYNPLRALRPARTSQQNIDTIQHAFNPKGFNFNKAFLKPEILWEGVHRQRNLRVLYNKFPFAPWHLLIVPEAEQQHPQFLDKTMHNYIMTLSIEYAEIFTGFGIGYNSLGAYASVNQLHFQAFIREDVLPIESNHWQHNGGGIAYPTPCIPCDNAQMAWELISAYQRDNQAYNLLYRANICYLMPRKIQASTDLEDWTQGLAWLELCGVFTLSELQYSTDLSVNDIEQQLAKLWVKTN
jgi:diadenosine tetraphosphate (Ap4A) HIT family hydrolase